MWILFFLVLEYISEWSIENHEEEQIFQKVGYGIKLFIPESSVEKGKQVKVEVKVIAPTKADIKSFPPDVEPVSCFYEINKITGEFKQPIKLCLQHNVELTSQQDCKQLTFMIAKGPPPYNFELVPFDIANQEFKVNGNSGIIQISDFSRMAIVWQKIIDPLIQMFRQPFWGYVVVVFVKFTKTLYWEVQAVVTKDLQPFLEVGSVNTNFI